MTMTVDQPAAARPAVIPAKLWLSRVVPRGGALWLLRNDLRMMFRQAAGGDKASAKSKSGWFTRIAPFLGFALLGGAFLLFGWIGAVVYAHLPMLPLTEAYAYMTIGLIGLFVLTLSATIGGVTQMLAERRDLDLLLTAPVKPRSILITRVMGVAIGASLLPLLITLPGAVVRLFQGSVVAMAMPLTAVGIAGIATACGLLMTMVLSRLIGAGRARVGAQMLGLFVGAAIFLATQPITRELLGVDRAIAQLANYGEEHSGAPVFAVARGSLGEWPSLLVLLVAAMGTLFFAAQVFAQRLAADSSSFSTPSAGRRASARDQRKAAASVRGGLLGAMQRKSMRTVGRDPLVITNVLYNFIYLIPLALILMRRGDGGLATEQLQSIGPGLAIWVCGLVTIRIGATVTAGEEARDLVSSAPVMQRRYDLGLVWSVFCLGIVPVIVLSAAFLLLSVANALIMLGIGAMAVFYAAISAVRWPAVEKGRVGGRPTYSRPWLVSLAEPLVASMWGTTATLTALAMPILILPAIIACWALLYVWFDLGERGKRRKAVSLLLD
jgi:ABC-2 type transport system permease protein